MKHLKKKKMRKFRLKKSYPGSPKIGTIVEKEFDTSFIYIIEESKFGVRYGVLKYHVEDNPEYWEEVIENKFMVSTRKSAFLNAYNVVKVNPNYKCNEYEKLFDSKEAAEEFIIYNKPCLSYSDLIWNFSENTKKNRLEVDIDDLRKLAKSKRDVCLAHRTKNEW